MKILTKVLDCIIPRPGIGSIHLTMTNTNPKNFFGGTWQLIAQGRTLVGVDRTQTEFNTVGKTGGSKTHTLTIDEMPSHTHTQPISDTVGGQTYIQPGYGGIKKFDENVSKTGGGLAHNNLQPYITVYMWKRTA